MNIVLPTNANDPCLEFRNCEKFADGSGYKVDILVKSGGFAAEIEFYFEEFPLNKFIDSLADMEKSLNGKAILKPLWDDHYLELEMLELGHLAVSGEFWQYSPYEQRFKFGFEIDQTSLRPFRSELMQLAELHIY